MKYGPPEYKAINFYGDEERQIAARQAFPILIELAELATESPIHTPVPPPGASVPDDTDSTRPTITYGELADKIGLNGRARWMRLPLGCIWQTLWEYQHESGIEIPYLTTIVVNAARNIPTIFKKYLNWSATEIADAQREVYDFQQWHSVMEHLMQRQQ